MTNEPLTYASRIDCGATWEAQAMMEWPRQETIVAVRPGPGSRPGAYVQMIEFDDGRIHMLSVPEGVLLWQAEQR